MKNYSSAQNQNTNKTKSPQRNLPKTYSFKQQISLNNLKSLMLTFCFALILSSTALFAQNTFPAAGSAGIRTSTPAASSLLEMVSTTKGILIPRMSIVQRTDIVKPATGLLIYQTDRAPGFYYFNGSAWVSVAGANTSLSNLTTTAINQSLTPSLNNTFILGGPVRRWNNIYAQSGDFAGDVNIVGNIFKGNSKVISFGVDNTTVGIDGLSSTAGSANSAFGYTALHFNNTGHDNTATGHAALFSNRTGSSNTAIGSEALVSDTSGSANTAVGMLSLYSNASGIVNTAVGEQSLIDNTSGSSNTAIGASSLLDNTTGHDNTAAGVLALASNTTGANNVAVGSNALFTNSASYNVAVGDYALEKLDAGTQDVAVGSKAGTQTTGNNNSYVGFQAGFYDNTSNNTAVGNQAGWTVANGSGCTFVGSQAGPLTAGFYNTSAIGYNATPTSSNQVRLGNSAVTSIGGAVKWSVISDGRFKRNIKENVPGLAFINKLKPVTYNLDVTSLRKFKGEDIKEGNAKMNADFSAQEKALTTGFVAQEVEATAKKMNYEFDGVDAPKSDKDAYGLRYEAFVVPLVKAVQELSKMNDVKDNKINDLEARVEKLEQLLSGNNTTAVANQSSVKLSSANAGLEQNTPNPFNSVTTIHYTLPQQYIKAQLIVTDQSGKIIQAIPVTGNGKGSVQVNASSMSSGIYQYYLLVDNKRIAIKQMMLTK